MNNMGLESGVGRLKNLMMSRFGYHRLPKSESQQPLLFQDSYYENGKYEYQSIKDEGNASSKKAISSLEKKVGFLDDQIYGINYGLHKLETDFHSTSVQQVASLSSSAMEGVYEYDDHLDVKNDLQAC
ncbi:uncharacterized protein LOC110696951 [Chenopodium quinoa]|uniref:uncharacterized protein LOC110696951 n=1 Tax=Chenopodium quinoa TaxID=63459 RepID=UPI000B7851EF|nr:uncharacterized protein LOC110696951 [Chenopodium quinoa]